MQGRRENKGEDSDRDMLQDFKRGEGLDNLVLLQVRKL